MNDIMKKENLLSPQTLKQIMSKPDEQSPWREILDEKLQEFWKDVYSDKPSDEYI